MSPTKPEFKDYRRETRWYTMGVSATPERVFPLLCPVRENEWIETWQCELIRSKSGFGELDCVFKTRHGDVEDVWVISKYQPNEFIEFVVSSRFRVMRYQFKLSLEGRSGTKIEIEQIATAVSKEGEDHVDDPHFEMHMKALEVMLNYYLTTGKMMKDEEAVHLAQQTP